MKEGEKKNIGKILTFKYSYFFHVRMFTAV